MSECVAEGCSRKAVSRGMCDKHYRRVLKHGDINYLRRRVLPIACATCGAIFIPKDKGTTHCSKSCASQNPRNADHCREMARLYSKDNGDKQRDKGEGKTYRKLYGRHEHRVVAERMLGRPLMKGEVVHHIDGNKRNNSPENLLVTTQGNHMKDHGLGIPGMALWWKPWESRRAANAV